MRRRICYKVLNMEYIYKIANTILRFVTNYELEEDGETSIFRIEQAEGRTVRTCYVEFVECLPEITGKLLVKNREKELYLQANEIWLQMENLSERVPTFIARYSLDGTGDIHLWALKKYYPYSARMAHIWSAIDLPYQLLQNSVLTLHSSVVEMNGAAIAFFAPSGTGKTTQAGLWCKNRSARQLNGDKTAIVCEGDSMDTFGLPFCGTSGICENYNLPLKSLVFLSQAKENTIRLVTGIEAWRLLLGNCFGYQMIPGCMTRMLELAEKILKKVPMYALACTPDERAVEVLEEAMKKEGR